MYWVAYQKYKKPVDKRLTDADGQFSPPSPRLGCYLRTWMILVLAAHHDLQPCHHRGEGASTRWGGGGGGGGRWADAVMPASRLLKATEPSLSICVRPLISHGPAEADRKHLKFISTGRRLLSSQESTFFLMDAATFYGLCVCGTL